MRVKMIFLFFVFLKEIPHNLDLQSNDRNMVFQGYMI